jgi:uncharacterized membrane protein YeaQ/YmgE (transglycosylase-associated protein family)
MAAISLVAVGLISGWTIGMLMTGSGYGVISDIIVGILGGLGGGSLAEVIFRGNGAFHGLDTISVVFALVGAVILIGVIRLVPRRGLA